MKDRPPAGRSQLGADMLRKREVDLDRLPGACDGPATVDQPAQRREGEVVAKPDDRTGGKQLINDQGSCSRPCL